MSKKQKPASRPQSALPGTSGKAGHSAAASQVPAAIGHSTALVLHQSAAQPESQTCAPRAAARSPVTHAGNFLPLVPHAGRHAVRDAVVLREEAQVAENLPNLVQDAAEYKVEPYPHLSPYFASVVGHRSPICHI